jgi:hypothetical protein
MKNRIFLLSALFVLIITVSTVLIAGCGDDDDDDDSDSPDDDADANDDLDDDADDDDADTNDDLDDDDPDDDDNADDDLNDDADDDDAPPQGDVQNGWNSECLSVKEEDPFTQQESYLMSFVDGVLSVEHINSCRNCEFDFEGTYEIDGTTLTITEYDVEPLGAFCDCWYNIDYEVPGLQADTVYQIEIYKIDDKDGFVSDPVLIMQDTLDLTQQTDFNFVLETYSCI